MTILQRVLDLANGIQGAILQFERHPEGGVRPSFPAHACTEGDLCGDITLEGKFCMTCQVCRPHDHTQVGKYAGRLIDRKEPEPWNGKVHHIDWCDAYNGPLYGPGCSCPCDCTLVLKCKYHAAPEETYFVDETGEYGPRRPGL